MKGLVKTRHLYVLAAFFFTIEFRATRGRQLPNCYRECILELVMSTLKWMPVLLCTLNDMVCTNVCREIITVTYHFLGPSCDGLLSVLSILVQNVL